MLSSELHTRHSPDIDTHSFAPEDKHTKMIQKIQQSQGDFPCFKTAYNYFCDPSHCVWKKECLGKDS